MPTRQKWSRPAEYFYGFKGQRHHYTSLSVPRVVFLLCPLLLKREKRLGLSVDVISQPCEELKEFSIAPVQCF